MNATIDSLNQEKARLDSEVKDLKKPKKEAKQGLDKATNEREALQDDVAEAERIDAKTKREEDRKNNLQTRKLESTRKNDIVKNKIEADKFDAEIHEKEIEHQQLQSQYDQNHAFNELKKGKLTFKNL